MGVKRTWVRGHALVSGTRMTEVGTGRAERQQLTSTAANVRDWGQIGSRYRRPSGRGWARRRCSGFSHPRPLSDHKRHSVRSGVGLSLTQTCQWSSIDSPCFN